MDIEWKFTLFETRWMQVCMMDGFLELESLNSLNSKLSETDTWYDTFQEHAEQALSAIASRNYPGAEVLFHQCKTYLGQAAEGVEEAVDQSPRLAIALCWVYLALANFYRYSHQDYWKAIEYLLLLLSTRAKIVSSSDSINEIRFALCLTLFEWVDELEDSEATKEALVVVPLEEARDIVEEWKTLNDAQVLSSFAYMLKLGYEKLPGRNKAASFWDQWLTNLMMDFVTTGDSFLDSLPKSRSSVEFQQQPENIQVCVRRFFEFGAKAKSATAGGHIVEALGFYKKCVEEVQEVVKVVPTSHFPVVIMSKMCAWAFEKIGRVYRLDLGDFSEACRYYWLALLTFMSIESHVTDTKLMAQNIGRLKIYIISIMYEDAYDMNTLLDMGRQTRLIAEAVLMARKLHFNEIDASITDTAVQDFIRFQLSREYDEMGRVGEAYFWNEERLKLMNKNDRLYDEVRYRSAYLLSYLGEVEKARKIVKSVLDKSISTQESLDGMLPIASALYRELYLQQCKESPTSDLAPMTDAVIDDAVRKEVRWTNEFLNLEPTDQNINEAKDVSKWNLLFYEGANLISKENYMEAIACFHSCLESISEGDRITCNIARMGCHKLIGRCHLALFFRAAKLELGIAPAGAYAGKGENLPAADHSRESIDNVQRALKIAEQIDDIYRMAEFNKWLGLIIFESRRFKIFHGHGSKGVYERLRKALDHYLASGRHINRFLYNLRDVNQLWISVLEREDSVSTGAFYRIQRSIIEIAKWELENMPPWKFLSNLERWSIEALLWAERSHSRTLAFKLTERNMGSSTRSELQKFDMDGWKEAWRRLRESMDASGPGTVMVEFIKSENSDEKFISYFVTYDGDVSMRLVEEEPKEDLEILLRKLSDHMSQKVGSELPNEEVMQILEDLYKAFFSPMQMVLDSMEEHHKLVICANKILAGVPFAALRNPETKKFLIERHTVVCTPSLRILKQCDQRFKSLQSCPLMESTGAALVLGDPAFTLEKDRLRASEDEANTIAAILGHQNVQVLKGRSALKKEVLDWVQRASTSGKYQALMHLATHGKGADEKFKEGALQFADPNVKTWPPSCSTPDSANSPCEQDNVSKNILILQSEYSREERLEEASSSTFVPPLQAQKPVFQTGGRGGSGPKRRRSNSCFLTSEEIVQDYEWRMLLVVLSACETAKGEVKSEGTLNLARALLISGVPSTIVSQWKVDDASAPVLMEGLYRAMKSGMDVASALRASMVAMIRNDVNKYHVHQWAPFVVMGLGTVTLPEQFLP